MGQCWPLEEVRATRTAALCPAPSGRQLVRGPSERASHAGKEHALAIGVTLASTAQIRAENKGNAVENTLWLNDGLWVMRTGAM